MYGTSLSCTKFSIYGSSTNPYNLFRDIICIAHPFFSYWRIQFCALQWHDRQSINRYASLDLVAALLILTMFREDRLDIQYRMTTVILVLLTVICLVMLSLGMPALTQSWINLSPLSGFVLILMSRRRINQIMRGQKRSDLFQ